MKVQNLTKQNFEEEVIKSDKPVLIDFFAVWCGPCSMVSPIIDEIAEERSDIKVCKIDVDEEQQLAMDYNVSSIPTICVFKNGKVTSMAVGARGKNDILSMLDD